MLKQKIIEAYLFAQERHKGQKRDLTDIDYFIHAKNVARIVEEMVNLYGNDEEKRCLDVLIIAALLHDTVENTKTTINEIVELFGSDVADIVQELTNDKDKIKKASKLIYMKEKVQSLSWKSMIIKLSDRFHNIHYLDFDRSHIGRIRKYYRETKEAFVDGLRGKKDFSLVMKKLYKLICSDIIILQIKYKL